MRRGPITIGVVQLKRLSGWEDSLGRAVSLIEKTYDVLSQADIVLFSENWLTRRPLSVDIIYRVADTLSKLLHRYSIGIHYINDNNKIKSIGYLVEGNRIIKICEKIFPSLAVSERGHVEGGSYHGPFTVRGWKIGCIACVDIFYPEVSRLHTLEGADILYNPASIPANRVDLWHSVLRTRAAENTVYSVGVNGTGFQYPDGRVTAGGSAVFAPDGTVAGKCGSGECVSLFTLTTDKIFSARSRWAFYDDLSMKLRGFYSILQSEISIIQEHAYNTD
ncbi:MAG: carbon-nitrogen hydrolase family protein [Desulfurococcales archaeon]|nr:carbon-nitrogen hydrolase family protein [Desulfurococcales archaeon]